MNNTAFQNAVANNGGVITDDICKKHGMKTASQREADAATEAKLVADKAIADADAVIEQAEADKAAALKSTVANSDADDDAPVEIPDDWESLHWKSQVKIAKQIIGGEVVAEDGQSIAEKAKAILAGHIAERAAE